METLPAVKDILRLAGDPRAFVLFNNLHPQGSQIAEQFKELTLGYCQIAACPVHLCQRAAYSNATADGKDPQEIDPEGKATAELNRLFSFTKETLTNGEQRNIEESATRA
jgi:chromosome partitioning protein